MKKGIIFGVSAFFASGFRFWGYGDSCFFLP